MTIFVHMIPVRYVHWQFEEKATKESIRGFGRAVTESRNWCRHNFMMMTTVMLSAFVLTAVLFIPGVPKEPNALALLGGLLINIVIWAYVGYLLYERYVGKLLRARGWAEESYWQGIQLSLLMIVLFWFLPVLLLVLIEIAVKLFS